MHHALLLLCAFFRSLFVSFFLPFFLGVLFVVCGVLCVDGVRSASKILPGPAQYTYFGVWCVGRKAEG